MTGRPAWRQPGVARPDLRLLGPALAAWSADVALLWGGAPTTVVAGVALGTLLLGAVVAVSRRPARRGGSPGAARRAGPGAAGVVALSLAAVALATTCLAGHDAVRSAGTLEALADDRAAVVVEATVATEPRPVRSTARPESEAQVVLRVHVDSVTGRGGSSAVSAPVLVIADARHPSPAWLARVRITGRLGPAQPGDDVVAVLRVTRPMVSVAEPPFWARAADHARERFRAATAALPEDPAGLVPALVLGDTAEVPADLTEAMAVSGLSHLSAVSGANISIVLALVLGCCRLVGLPRRARPLVAGGALVAFVVLVRPEPSVVRATAMGLVGLLALGATRSTAGVPALSTAVVALLCWDPWLARSHGFALSVLATLGLLLLARPWGERLGRLLPRPVRSWGPALAVPVAAQVMCAPVVVLLQGSVSLVAVPANLVAGPLVAPATVVGVGTALTALVWAPAAQLLAWGAGLPAWGIALVARWAAELSWAQIPWPAGPTGALLLAALTAAAVLLGPWLLAGSIRSPVAALVIVLVVAGAAAPVGRSGWPPAGWRLVACDVGQGDALVLANGPGRAVLVDVGPEPALVAACLRRLAVRVVDAVVLTHFHADHVAGLPGVLRSVPVGEVLVSPVSEPRDQVEQVRAWTARAEVPVSVVRAGDRLVWPDLQARVWWPARTVLAGSVANNGSVVLSVTWGDLRAVLLGDIERESAALVDAALRAELGGPAERPDVVKVAHHGSANRDDDLLDLLQPVLAVISVGADNDYGHPAPATLLALRRRGIPVLRTDQVGDIAVAGPGSGQVRVGTSRGPPPG